MTSHVVAPVLLAFPLVFPPYVRWFGDGTLVLLAAYTVPSDMPMARWSWSGRADVAAVGAQVIDVDVLRCK